MSTSESNSSKQFHAVDPLGEVARRAREIWIERGQPTGSSPDDFLSEAELDLLGGRSAGIPSHRTRHKVAVTPIPLEIHRLQTAERDPLIHAIAHGINFLLNEHECYCLSRFLAGHEFSLRNSPIKYAPSDDEIASILAAFANEYPESFLKQYGVIPVRDIPLPHRQCFWRNRMSEWKSVDEPLTYHDRNTTQRLLDALSHSEFFSCAILRSS